MSVKLNYGLSGFFFISFRYNCLHNNSLREIRLFKLTCFIWPGKYSSLISYYFDCFSKFRTKHKYAQKKLITIDMLQKMTTYLCNLGSNCILRFPKILFKDLNFKNVFFSLCQWGTKKIYNIFNNNWITVNIYSIFFHCGIGMMKLCFIHNIWVHLIYSFASKTFDPIWHLS